MRGGTANVGFSIKSNRKRLHVAEIGQYKGQVFAGDGIIHIAVEQSRLERTHTSVLYTSVDNLLLQQMYELSQHMN